MPQDQDEIVKTDQVIDSIRAELDKVSPSRRQRIMEAIALAALGSVPWVGGVLAAAATFKFDESCIRGDKLRNQWLQEHHEKLGRLRATLAEMGARFEGLGEEIDDRIESEDYLALVRKTFVNGTRRILNKSARCWLSSLRMRPGREYVQMISLGSFLTGWTTIMRRTLP